MSLGRFRDLSEPFIQKAGIPVSDEKYLLKVLEIVKEKIKLFKDVPDWIGYFFTEEFPFEPEAVEKTLKKPGALDRLSRLRDKYAGEEDWSVTGLEVALKKLATELGCKIGELVHPARVAVSGRSIGPSLYRHVRGHGQIAGSPTNGPGSAKICLRMNSLTLQSLRERHDPNIRLLVIGDPIDHSLSPPMHNAALEFLRLPYVYGRLRVSPENLREAFQILRQQEFIGWNLTLPHKLAGHRYAGRARPMPQRDFAQSIRWSINRAACSALIPMARGWLRRSGKRSGVPFLRFGSRCWAPVAERARRRLATSRNSMCRRWSC